MITFNNTYTAAVAGNQAYLNCISAAENFISSNWTNSITLNITWDAQNAGTNTFLASNSWPAFVNVSYATLRSALAAHANNPDAQAAVASLPATDPTFSYAGSHLWSLPEAYGRMLGLSTTVYSPDDTITLNTSYTWSYGQDVIDALEHEISEGGMGRVRSRRPEHRLEHDGSVPIVVAAVPALPPGTAPRSTPCGFVTDELDLRLA